jgi:hypothetical protein
MHGNTEVDPFIGVDGSKEGVELHVRLTASRSTTRTTPTIWPRWCGAWRRCSRHWWFWKPAATNACLIEDGI